MKKNIFICVLAGLSAAAFAQTSGVIQEQVNNNIDAILGTYVAPVFNTIKPGLTWLPNAVLQENMENDAYIGGEGIVPWTDFRFTLGETIGFASDGVLADLGDTLGVLTGSGGTLSGLPILPVFAFDFRIGGIYLPFDLGFSILQLEGDASNLLGGPFAGFFPGSIGNPKVNVGIKAFGVDFRYRILEEGYGLGLLIREGDRKQAFPTAFWKEEGFYKDTRFWRQFIPEVSVGAGYARYSLDMGISHLISVNNNDADIDANINFFSQALYLSVQASKKIFFLRPYVGARFALAQSSAAVAVAVDIAYVAPDGQLYPGHGQKSLSAENDWLPATLFFWGLGVDCGFLQLDFGVSYNLNDPAPDAEGMHITFRFKF